MRNNPPRLQAAQLWLHRNNRLISRVIVGFVIGLLLLFSIVQLIKINEQSGRIAILTELNKRLNEQTNILARQAVKNSEENQDLAKQNRTYSRCIAEIFAKFTRDDIPITILNLDTCQIGNQSDAKTNAPTSGPTGTNPTPKASIPNNNSPQSSTKLSNPSPTGTSPQGNPPAPQPSPSPSKPPDNTIGCLPLNLLCL